ncbi:hypothetical protein K435DRAFT_780083 [Dendrothele bispora CBS 962.96]|uniref:F-box domain-containing protein n=1 Tax=Dendrothele bispora (strain CBS 962.96) TaxID=1314807 RepID=A0A4S8LU81_DENBC|nr:hypothetical protein K435DRAFT_780083 [Dendrothele bispora CBS 962.96]
MGFRHREFCTSTFQQFPWAQITTLKLSTLRVSDLWKFLGRCAHLSELTVHNIRRQELARRQSYLDLMNRTNFFTFLGLASIDIRFEDSKDLAHALTIIFSKMTAPALKHLTLSSFPSRTLPRGCPRPTWPLDVFSNFAARSADRGSGLFTLSSLHIKAFPITVFDLLSVLNRLPCLIELEITEPNDRSSRLEERSFRVSDEFLYGLCIGTTSTGPRLGEEPCAPRLLHFCMKLTPRCKPEFRTETLNEMVRSRWIPDPACASAMGVVCLRSIKVVGDERTGAHVLGYESLRELESSGLQVEIS